MVALGIHKIPDPTFWWREKCHVTGNYDFNRTLQVKRAGGKHMVLLRAKDKPCLCNYSSWSVQHSHTTSYIREPHCPEQQSAFWTLAGAGNRAFIGFPKSQLCLWNKLSHSCLCSYVRKRQGWPMTTTQRQGKGKEKPELLGARTPLSTLHQPPRSDTYFQMKKPPCATAHCQWKAGLLASVQKTPSLP